MSLPVAKITTVKSFKGLESRVVIVLAEGGRASKESSSELYVALTRVKDCRGQGQLSVRDLQL